MGFEGNSVFWIEVEKIVPNPFQPRREFDQGALQDLAESIRMYGVLQPLVVTRKEMSRDDGIAVEYELISGERRLRASKLAGIKEVPALIRTGPEDDKLKLELAIIENLQREDLNAVDRAKAFARLINEFGMKHAEVGKRVGKSREYVSNSVRILGLPPEIITALSEGKITEGHTRPILMLMDRPEEQKTLFIDIMNRRLTVRETEEIARRIAFERVRKPELAIEPEMVQIEERLKEALKTKVFIHKGAKGGRITIDFITTDDLRSILSIVESAKSTVFMKRSSDPMPSEMVSMLSPKEKLVRTTTESVGDENIVPTSVPVEILPLDPKTETAMLDDRSKDEKESDETDLYDIKNFSV